MPSISTWKRITLTTARGPQPGRPGSAARAARRIFDDVASISRYVDFSTHLVICGILTRG